MEDKQLFSLSFEKDINNNKLPYIITKNNIENNNNQNNNNINNDSLKSRNIKIKKTSKDNDSHIINDNKFNDYLKKHIRSIYFNNMLSRHKKNTRKTHQIENICYPCTPNYSSIYPKIAMKVFYNKNNNRKDFSPKLKGMKDELTFNIDKVYNKYNNHKEPKSFSLDKMLGRYKKDEKNNLTNIKDNEDNKEIETERRNQSIKNKINIIKSYFINQKINSRNKKSKNENDINNIYYNNILENVYKKLIEKYLLNDKNMTEIDKKIINGNKLKVNYKKLMNYYKKIKIILK